MKRLRTSGTARFLAPLLLVLANSASALNPTRDKILYVVGNAHLDTEWNWTIQDTINTYIPKTLHTNFTFFARYPHYCDRTSTARPRCIYGASPMWIRIHMGDAP